MKFGDKLIALRKKKGLSQEELAEKLGVSRQSVSKWESNNTYPETDKIVQICNIFECTMDDLINDNITDITKIERKNKNNINVIVDSFLDFITKIINMFSRMSFISGFKCVIEMVIITIIMITLGLIIINFSRYFFGFYPFDSIKGIEIINGILRNVLMIIWTIISIIVLVHVFKIRYLNYYDEIINTEKDDKEKDKKSKIKEDKRKKIIIRDENSRPFAFLSVLSKIIIMFVKIFIFFLGLFFAFTLLMLAIMLVVSVYFNLSNIAFIGSTLSLLSLIIINIIILILIIGFIFNKKYNYKILLITFLISILTTGIGIGIFFLGVKDFKVVDNMNDILNLTTYDKEIDYKDNMFVINNEGINVIDYSNKINYEIDNSLEDGKIKISGTYDDKYIKMDMYKSIEYKMNIINVYYHQQSSFTILSDVINDLKNNIIRNYDFNYFDLKVTANENIINKLMDNLSKLYNYDYSKKDNTYEIYNLQYKIEDDTGDMCRYNASINKLDCGSYNDKCYVKKTNIGDREYINISCDDDYTTE